MKIEDIESIGYKVKGNYIIKECDDLGYSIRVLFPYGLADGYNNFYTPYVSSMLAIIDNACKFPSVIGYKITPNMIIMELDVFSIDNVNYILGMLFNTMNKFDIDKLIDGENGYSIIQAFLDNNDSIYRKSEYDYIRGKDSIENILYQEYQDLLYLEKDKLKEYFNNTKNKIKEENAIVVIKGNNISTLTFSEYDYSKFKKNTNIKIEENNKYTNLEDAYHVLYEFTNSEDYKANFHKYNFLGGFLSSLIPDNKMIIDIPNKIYFYYHILDAENMTNPIFSDKWYDDIFINNINLIKSQFEYFCGTFSKGVIGFYESSKNNIDTFIDIFSGNELIYNKEEVQNILAFVNNYKFDDFIIDLRNFIKDLKPCKKEKLNG